MGFLKDKDGNWSSKRLFALTSFVVAIVLAFMGRDTATISVFMGASTAVFVGQAISKT